MVTNCSETQYDTAVRPTYLPNLHYIRSKSWNRGLKYSQSCHFLQLGFRSFVTLCVLVSLNVIGSENDSPASSGGQWKYMKYVSFSWLPVEAALSIFNFRPFV